MVATLDCRLRSPRSGLTGLLRRLVGAALVLLAACTPLGGMRSVEVSQAQIEGLLARQFPRSTTWRDLFELTASAPRLRLLPESNRIAIELDVLVDERLFNRQYPGLLALESGLRYEAADHTLRLLQPSLERLNLVGLPGALQGQLDRVGLRIAAQWLNDHVVYTLRERDIERLVAANVEPGEVRVTATGVTIELRPRP